MNIVSAVVTFSILWWLIFFIILPIGIEINKSPEPGHASGAPVRILMKRKLLQTTVVSLFVFGNIYWIIQSEILLFLIE